MMTMEEGKSHDMPEKVSLSMENLFVEKEETYELVAVVTSVSSSVDDKDDALARLRRIFDTYLECPTLLDQSVGRISTKLMQAAQEVICSAKCDSKAINFHQCSHSLSVLYALSKVRGRKNIQKFLSHEVEDVEPILSALQQFVEEEKDQKRGNNETVSNNSDRPQRWESLYILWNWLGALSLVPFDCTVVLADASLVSALIGLGKTHLSATGPTREVAASCLAAWLSRPDLENSELSKFVEWSSHILQDCCQKSQAPDDVFLVLGVMQTLVTILKVSTSPRENILFYMSPLWEPFILLAESNVCDSNLLLRKLMVKWWYRMGCAYMPPRVASWRYQRGRRSLVENLQQQNHGSDSVTPSTQADGGQPTTTAQCEGSDMLVDVPDHVEDAMGFIIQALSDQSTAVRWPAAKGVGRLTERLPSVCADDVLDAVLELFVNPEADQAWHGACLALAELARRGLLLPNRLAEVVPLVVRAIQYDLRKGQSSVGSHVRDAACYTYWSFARAYAPTVLKPFVTRLSESIVLTCLFDREVNCRRAASAAFQECVGRQGADNFKHGIAILTTADYFALGNRSDSFTSISLYVAQFREYQRKIIDHVYKVKLHHWDETIRVLASKSLFGLTSLDSNYIIDEVVPSMLTTSLDPKNIPVRHGSILGLAETIAALGSDHEESIEARLPEALLQEIAEIIPTIEKKRLYRGRGGEMIRGAVCRLISCICVSKVPLIAKQQVRLLDSIDACLPHPNEDIQEKACDALRELTCNYFPVGPAGPSDRLQKRVVDKYLATAETSENPASTRGFSLALGHLPKKLLAPSPVVLDAVVNILCTIARHDAKVGNEKDAETRRNALIALRRTCQTVGIAPELRITQRETADNTGLDSGQISVVFDAFFAGLEDYNVDRRGDVGSWCRIEAMKGLEAMACLVVEQASQETLPDLFGPSIAGRMIGALLKQFSEKLDNARVEAGSCLQRILNKRDPEIPCIPEKQYLQESLGLVQSAADKEQYSQNRNWADASLTFPMVAKAASVSTYFPFIIAGMIISVGGLTESVAKQSNAALLNLAKQAKGGKRIADLGETLLELFKSHSRDARVILPLLKTLDILLSHRCLNDLILLDATSSFRESLLKSVSKEAMNCSDVHRLFACVDVALGLVGDGLASGSSDDVEHHDKALAFACAKLLHRFPRVRRYAAEHIYVCLLEHPDLLKVESTTGSKFDLDSLLKFPWDDAKTTALQCREKAQRLADAVQVPLPQPSMGAAGQNSSKKKVPLDDFASYAALVDSMP